MVIFINGFHTSSRVRFDDPKYWNGQDRLMMRHLRDTNAVYVDGARGIGATADAPSVFELVSKTAARTFMPKLAPFLDPLIDKLGMIMDPYKRKSQGEHDGAAYADAFAEKLPGDETIKIVTHSMGAAYAKGFIHGLRKSNRIPYHSITLEVDFAPFQGWVQTAADDVPTFTITHKGDLIADGKVKGAENIIIDNNANLPAARSSKSVLIGLEDHAIRNFTAEEIEKAIPARLLHTDLRIKGF